MGFGMYSWQTWCATATLYDVDEPLKPTLPGCGTKFQMAAWNEPLYQANHLSYHVHEVVSLLEAARIFDELGVFYEQGVVAELLGRYAYQQRRPPSEVTGYYNQARQFYLKLKGYLPHTRSFLLMLVDLYFREGNYEQGLHFEDENENWSGWARCAVGIHEHWESCLRLDTALMNMPYAFGHNIEMIRRLGSQSDLAWRWFELGEVHRIFGKPDLALNLFDQAYPIFEKMNVALGLGFDQRARGDLALEDKRYSDALAHYQNFYAFATEDNQIWTIARRENCLANAYLGNFELARKEMRALAQAYEYREDDWPYRYYWLRRFAYFRKEMWQRRLYWRAFCSTTPVVGMIPGSMHEVS
jgi:tetratricopeptide (TPR) repeat protein